MASLDFDSVRQAPGYLLSKATNPSAWNSSLHPRGVDGEFISGQTSKAEAALHAVLGQPVLHAESLRLDGLTFSDALNAGRQFFGELMLRSPMRCPAMGGSDVVFDEHGWKYITDESYARQFDVNKDRGMDEVRLRLSLLPKAAAAISGAVSLEGPARVDHGTKRYPIIARFSDGDVIRVILEEHQEGSHRFLSVFDLERVAKKLKRVSGPDSLHKASHSTVQGSATGDASYTCIVDDQLILVNRSVGTSKPDYDSLCKSEVYVARYSPSHAPSVAQLDAGNYAKRRVKWHGMTVSVENEAGSVRCGTKPDGSPWETRMVFPYGYLLRTEGVDGDHVDVFLGPDLDAAPFVYVIHQRKVDDWLRYDEDKAMLGFASEADAVHAFLQCYDDFRFLGPVTTMPVAEFVSKARATFGAPAMIKSMEHLDFGQEMLAKSEPYTNRP